MSLFLQRIEIARETHTLRGEVVRRLKELDFRIEILMIEREGYIALLNQTTAIFDQLPGIVLMSDTDTPEED